GRDLWQMRRVMNLRHTRRNRLDGSEYFRVHIPCEHSSVSQPIAHILQECRWAIQIEVTTLRHDNSLQQSYVNVPGGIEVYADAVDCSGPAVHDVFSTARELFQ